MEKYTKEIKKFISNNWKAILLFICVIAFLMLAFNVFDQKIISADIAGHNIIQTEFKSDISTQIAKFITNFGGASYLTIITILPISTNSLILFLLFFSLILTSI